MNFTADCRYYNIIYHGSHWISFLLEYTVLPIVLFIVVLRVVKKETSTNEYVGYGKLIEIASTNWQELVVILFFTWLTFELRVFFSFIDNNDPRNVFMPTVWLLSPFVISLITIGLLTIFVLCFHLLFRIDTGKFSNLTDEKNVLTVKKSVLPILVLSQLIISVLLYPFPSARIVASLLAIFVLAFLRHRWWYTSSYWWKKAQLAYNNKTNITDQYTSFDFLIKSFQLRTKSHAVRKVDDFDQSLKILETIYDARETERDTYRFVSRRRWLNNKLNRIVSIIPMWKYKEYQDRIHRISK